MWGLNSVLSDHAVTDKLYVLIQFAQLNRLVLYLKELISQNGFTFQPVSGMHTNTVHNVLFHHKVVI